MTIESFFNDCVHILEVIGDFTGMGYFLANIVIFVILQPLLILIFFILWRYERTKRHYELRSGAGLRNWQPEKHHTTKY
jgi:uncharacterized membrane protein